ncbi:unnamed protein product [Parnassius mnemosyne]|uniref:Farnesyl pyrophosphate synthase n=1 Tax=Parnassius mnemosyne TaxID=213953 RepID=A0AAV1KPE5_9NEOP
MKQLCTQNLFIYSKIRYPAPVSNGILSRNDYEKFQKSIPIIIEKGVQAINVLKPAELRDRMRRIAEYSTQGRKFIQSEMAILCNEVLRKPEEIKGELQIQQTVLAFCVQMVMAYIIIIDDIEDGSKTRNGKPCWHLLPDVGNLAMNDASMFRSFIYEILKQNFQGSTYYDNILNLFNEAFLTCNVGQYFDAVTVRNKNYADFTMERYKMIAYHKFGYFASKFPVLSALILCNKFNKDSQRNIDNILTDIGIWGQIYNDLTDFFDDDKRTGKTGSDIQTGKCTWLAVTALQRCNEKQRKEFEACYGSWEPENVNRIRKLYEDLNILNIYFHEERATYEATVKKIQSLPSNALPSPDFFQTILDKYYPTVSCGESYNIKSN